MKRNFVIAPRDGDREREREKCKVFRGVLFILLRPVRKLFRFSVCNRFLYVTNRVPLSFLCTLYYFILDESDNWSVTWRIEAGTQAFVVWGEMKKCRVRFGGEEASNLPESTIEYRFPVWRCCLKILEHHVSLKTLSSSILRAQLFQR